MGVKIQLVFNQRQNSQKWSLRTVNQLATFWMGFGGMRWAEYQFSDHYHSLILDCPSGGKPPNGSYPGWHSRFWDVLLGSPPSLQSSGTQALGGCCKIGCNAAFLKQLWLVLVMALAIALLVLGVLGWLMPFHSLSSQSVSMVLPSVANGLNFTCVSTCFFFWLCFKYTCSHFITSRKVLSSAGSSSTIL